MVLPYPQGFDSNKRFFAYCYSISIVMILYSVLWFLTIGIISLSLAKEGKNVFLFLHKFSREEKEGDALQVQI
jgi:hypothetical protein